MANIYWFTLVIGGGLLLFSLLGDIFGADAGEIAGDVEGSGHGAGDTGTSSWLSNLSLRNMTYALFGFGLTGVALDFIWHGARPLPTLLSAVLAGLLAARLNALVLGYIRRTDSGGLAGDDTISGLVGRVTLPLAAGGTGKIEVERGGREYELLARAYEAGVEEPEQWTSVVVVAMDDGVALVVPLDPVDTLGPIDPEDPVRRLDPVVES